MDKHKEVYREEACELLAELETSLLELEDTPDDMEQVGRVFRALHTIKGSGAMFGFDDIAEFTHEVETVFDLVRERKIRVTAELVNLTLAARDQIKALLEVATGGEAVNPATLNDIITALQKLRPDNHGPGQTGKPRPAPPDIGLDGAGPGREITYRIRFKPLVDIFRKGTCPTRLLNELRELGECNVVAHPQAIPDLTVIDPEGCYTYWDIILTTDQGLNAIKDVFIFVEDDAELHIKVIDDDDHGAADQEYKRIGEILVERGDITAEDLARILGKQQRLGEVLIDAALVERGKITAALVEQEHVKQRRQRRQELAAASTIRVDAAKLDNLVNLVGELVTVQARLSQKSSGRKDPELSAIAEEVERLTEELRDNTMSIRMLPIGSTFNKFRRLVRDLSNELGKELVMTTVGAETELDKTVIEQLNDPLIHLIRNSIDHGIEPPAVRERAGKNRQGTIHLSARHVGANVLIQIADDGAGLDPALLLAKAKEKGLVSQEAQPSEQEIYAYLFMPGFSTAKTISDVSGRGVGMDVVKRGIENLGGTVEISSRKGTGTTITLKLPLTLAIIDGLLVKIDKGYYVLPLAVVEECLELRGREADLARRTNMMNFRGQVFSYLNLREEFLVGGNRPDQEKVVITGINGEKVGLAVDQVIGQHQTVIKRLSKIYKNVQGFSGATILGDGTVALILDVPQLIKTCRAGGRESGQVVH